MYISEKARIVMIILTILAIFAVLLFAPIGKAPASAETLEEAKAALAKAEQNMTNLWIEVSELEFPEVKSKV